MCGYGYVKALKPQRETDHTTDMKPMNDFNCALRKHKMSKFMTEYFIVGNFKQKIIFHTFVHIFINFININQM